MPTRDESHNEETVRLSLPDEARRVNDHRFFADNKTRVARIHQLLEQAGQRVDPEEVSARRFGASTAAALRAFGGTSEVSTETINALKARALQVKLSTKTQAGAAQKALRRALEIAKLPVPIDANELNAREFGPSTRAAITAFQRKYGLPQTGEFDPGTWERMASVNASRPQPPKWLDVSPQARLVPVAKQLRLNMQGPQVGRAQEALARSGLSIAAAEHGQQRFGGTTRNAVLEFQRRKRLPLTGHLDKPTLRALNFEITGGKVEHSYRLKGSVRDELWLGLSGVTVSVFDRPLRGEGELLASRKTLANGFFDVPYAPVSRPAHVKVTFTKDGEAIGSRVVFNPTKIGWVNLTLGEHPYRGMSEFEAQTRAVSAVLGDGVSVVDLVETEEIQEITRVALAAGLTQDAVMRLLLSHKAADDLGEPLSPAACFGFIAQNLPPSLPTDLLASTNEWEDIDRLVQETATGLGFLDPQLAASAFDAATAANLFPITVITGREPILAALASRRTTFALDKPILTGAGTLRGVLSASALAELHFPTVAEAFVRHQGAGPEFWSEIQDRAGELGGPQAVADLRTTIDVAQIAANHAPLVAHLKQVIAGAGEIRSSRDLAKLTIPQWEAIAGAAGGGVTATDLAQRSEQLFPDVAFAAQVGRTAGHNLSHVTQVAAFIDEQPDFKLRDDTVDSYVAQHASGTDPAVVTEMRVMQRAHRLAPTAAAGSQLLAAGLHSSVQIVGLGKDGLAAKLATVDVQTRSGIFAYAELQYAQVLKRIAGYRLELQLANPAALSEQNLTLAEIQEVLGEIPNLEVLFGSLDYCDCEGCMSVYSPAAYLADLMRFLSQRPAVTPGTDVLEVLLDRRPDLVDIKLNCANTETPMPYIDLVCEALENAVPAVPGPPSGLQTTRTAEDLRAFPEHLRAPAYDTLRQADFLTAGFDLWQEEARMLLDHLSVPRHELMAAFAGGNPSQASIAGEYFGLSSHATTMVTTAADNAAAQQEIWGLDATRTQLTASEFLQHSRISYDELLELLRVSWLSESGVGQISLQRPDGTCDLDKQLLEGFTPAAFDRIHRFLRLWRHTGWQLHELGLLLGAAGVGGEDLDAAVLVRLHRFAEVAQRLKLPFTPALSLYRSLNTQAEPDQTSQYAALFQNRLVTNPLNPAFTLPLSGTEPLAAHHATLAAAYQVTEAELALLLARTGPLLTLDNLTAPLRYVTVARGLKIPIGDLLSLVDLCQATIPDPFATPQTTADLIGLHEDIASSGFTVAELDYLLNHRPDSPFDLREASITQQVEGLRESLRTTPAADLDGQVAAYVASTFGLSDRQAAVTLANLALLADLSHPDLLAQDADGTFVNPVTAAAFPQIYHAWRLIHKTAILIRRMRMDEDVLAWLLDRAATFGWLNPSAVPVEAAPTTPLFDPWHKLAQWLQLRSRYPEPEGVSLDGIFDLASSGAPIGDIRAAVAALTRADVDDLTTLDGGSTAVYTDPEALRGMLRIIALNRRLGVDVVTARSWARRDDESGAGQRGVTQEIAQIVKAKYDHEVWLSRITPIQDALRERKRAALVNYLLEHSARHTPRTITFSGKEYANPKYWREPDDMLRYFLLDVQMSACQLTSRIKQAIGSVQMFVQRCQLNLERPFVAISADEAADTTSLDSWRHWTWMKNYRVWEANRKVFLYPENWIEPELRDDKSPFFEELEDDVLKGEISDATCEAAFHRYLRKVHEVSRLTVAGTYHEIDDDTNVLHVVARTPAEPARYYYRTFDLSYGQWTAWEKIELDIVGDHVVPVVYNRKLHLFWLIFAEKTQKVRKQPPARASETPTDSPEPPNLLEIQLAWSVRTSDGFDARRTCPYALIHPWQRPTSAYHLKPRYKPQENHLWIDIYLSTTREFNNTRFFDPYANQRAFVTATRFDETLRPWHSSSFVFDGEVVALKLKPLKGQYRVLLGNGTMSENLVQTDSYNYVHDTGGEDGKELLPLVGPYETAPRLVLPEGMHFEYTRLTNNRRKPNPRTLRVISGGQSTTLAKGAKSPFELAQSSHQIQYDVQMSLSPMVYQDRARSFFIRAQWRPVFLPWYGADGFTVQWINLLNYTWYPFYHPYTALFLRELNRSGINGLLNRRIQRFPQSYPPGNTFSFSSYQPAGWNGPDETAKNDVVDFQPYGAYSQYNWEIFFHAPLLIAGKLMANQRFEEAMQWYHRIFDPTNAEALSAPQRYWITKPFFDQNSADYRKQRITELLQDIGSNLDQLRAWKNNPFNPHLIARHRPVAFQRAVVMKYIDNLIAWGDQLFRRDTLESINEATLLYVLAAELLGPRPVKVPPIEPAEMSYAELVADGALDPFGNKKVEVLMENFVSPTSIDSFTAPDVPPAPLPHLEMLYFGIPANTKLLSYWDTVADRLFKVRHCMNIEGTVRQLPLFEPPIDPALLVKAAAAGIDLSSVLGLGTLPAGLYRFQTLADKAATLCSEVRALGERLLSVLERRDAEGLALLQAGNELALRQAIKAVREEQVDEALKNQAALEKGLAVLDKRIEYYGDIPRMNAWEIAGTVSHGLGIVSEIVATVLNAVAGGTSFIPYITGGAAGFGGSPVFTVSYGAQPAKAAFNFAALFNGLSGILHHGADMLNAQGGYTRQDQANQFNKRLAELERDQLEVQIEAAAIRHGIAELELTNHELGIEHADSALAHLKTKYTNEQLFGWLLAKLSTVYFQAYQLAFDLARRAEQAFQLELSDPSASFIQFGYWDSLKKGLLAAERLSNDLRRMEVAYLDRHTREFELTKHISLAEVAPLSLLALKLNGGMNLALPEWLFDLDYPGHYRRRIKSVALSIPCVVGPYTSINCTLSLTNNGVRLTDSVAGGYGDPLAGPDERFARNPVPTAAIATSHASNDRGMFELRFSDERYLPFEFAGAVSEWRIDLPKENNRFDFATISDVILHLDYTAIPGSTELADAAKANLAATLPTSGTQLLVLDEQFATAWHRMLHPDEGEDQTLKLTLTADHLPFWAKARIAMGAVAAVSAIDLILDTDGADAFEGQIALPTASGEAGPPTAAASPLDPAFGSVPHLAQTPAPGTALLGDWQLRLRKSSVPTFTELEAGDVRRAYLVVRFTMS